jgi:hypothetical protein
METIELLLDLDKKFLSENNEAMEILRREFYLENEPSGANGLVRVLKLAMDTCTRLGIRYPRVFLLRKGQLSRGEFQPRVLAISAASTARYFVASHPKVPREWTENAAEEFNRTLNAKRKI